MNKRIATTEAITRFTKNIEGVNDEVYREQVEELAQALHKVGAPPMSSWKKKFIAGMVLIGGFWVLFHYLHYEACREKFPQVSGWVCMMQSS